MGAGIVALPRFFAKRGMKPIDLQRLPELRYQPDLVIWHRKLNMDALLLQWASLHFGTRSQRISKDR